MEAPGSHVVKRAHLSRSSSRKILDQPDTGIGRTGHGEEVRQRLVSRSQLLWTWAHFLSAIGLIGGVTAGVIVIWTQLDEQGLDPEGLYTECGPNQFQCRKQRINCPGRDPNGQPRVDCEAPAGDPICLPNDPGAAGIEDPTTRVEAGSAVDKVMDGYLDCIADDQTVSDFSDEMTPYGGPDDQLKMVLGICGMGAIVLVYSLWSLIVSVTATYYRMKLPLFKSSHSRGLKELNPASKSSLNRAESGPEPEPEPETHGADPQSMPERDHKPSAAIEAASAARAERLKAMPRP